MHPPCVGRALEVPVVAVEVGDLADRLLVPREIIVVKVAVRAFPERPLVPLAVLNACIKRMTGVVSDAPEPDAFHNGRLVDASPAVVAQVPKQNFLHDRIALGDSPDGVPDLGTRHLVHAYLLQNWRTFASSGRGANFKLQARAAFPDYSSFFHFNFSAARL